MIFDDPYERGPWEPHGTDGWYNGPAPEHHLCYIFYVPATKSTCIAGTAEYFPAHCKMPQLSTTDAATQAANDLIQALKKPAPSALVCSLTTKHHAALKQLAEIFNNAIVPPSEPSAPRVKTLSLNEPAPRVDKSKFQEVTTSFNPTSPKQLQTQPVQPHKYPT
eukprot:5424915-Ditylum_brightwellii.AAC.1